MSRRMTRKSLMFSESYDLNYSCLLLYVPVHVFHQRCVHMHKVLRPVPKAFVTGIAHLRPGLWFRLKKPFIYVRRHMCLYCVCVRWNDVHNKFLTLWDCFKTNLSATRVCVLSMTSFPWFFFALSFHAGVALIFCHVVNVLSC
jgi:hypothetical protein